MHLLYNPFAALKLVYFVILYLVSEFWNFLHQKMGSRHSLVIKKSLERGA